jgi:hypothetical protein
MTKHGATSFRKQPWPEYNAWAAMIQRCENPNNPRYPQYGGRGIRVAPAFHDFRTFIRHVGRRPKKRMMLDRIDNDRGYVPGNLRWATRKESHDNQRHGKKHHASN